MTDSGFDSGGSRDDGEARGGTYGGGEGTLIDVVVSVGGPLQTTYTSNNGQHDLFSHHAAEQATDTSSKGEASMTKRERLPAERNAVNHAFRIGDLKFYLTVGLYPDGRPGEIFLKVKPLTHDAPLDDLPGVEAGKGPGGFANGMCDAFGTMASLALQYGCPLEKMCEKLENMNFAPAQLGHGKSVMDYIAKWLMKRFPSAPVEAEQGSEAMETAEVPAGSFDLGQLAPEGSPCYSLDPEKLGHGHIEPVSCKCAHHHYGGGDLSFCVDCAHNAAMPDTQCYLQEPSDLPGHTIVGCTGKVPA